VKEFIIRIYDMRNILKKDFDYERIVKNMSKHNKERLKYVLKSFSKISQSFVW